MSEHVYVTKGLIEMCKLCMCDSVSAIPEILLHLIYLHTHNIILLSRAVPIFTASSHNSC